MANFRRFLDARPPDAPFYFWAGILEPHGPWGPDNHEQIGIGLDAVKLPGFIPDTPGVRRARGNYLSEVRHADRTLAALLSLIEERGELADTLVIVTADNGTGLPQGEDERLRVGRPCALGDDVARTGARRQDGR